MMGWMAPPDAHLNPPGAGPILKYFHWGLIPIAMGYLRRTSG
jgi:hypothetical protein